MKGGSKANGYTILEVLIFLSVSTVLLVSALYLVGGQQAKTFFTQSVINLQSKIEDIINDNNNGFYTKEKAFSCNVVSGAPYVYNAAKGKGENVGCTYLGRFIQFYHPATGADQLIIHTVVGRQFKAGTESTIVKSYAQADPISIYPTPPPSDSEVDGTEVIDLDNGLTVSSVKIVGEGNTNAVGFLANLDQYKNYNTASLSTNIVSFVTTGGLTESASSTAANIKNFAGYKIDKTVEICVNGGTTVKSAKITTGLNNGLLSTNLQYFNNPDCT